MDEKSIMKKIRPHRKPFQNTTIPEDWEVKKLGEICKLKSGGTPLRKKETYWNGSIPWVTTTLVNFNTILDTEEFITEEGLKNSSANIFPKGTTIMAIYGQGITRGKVAQLGIDASTNQACVAFLKGDLDFQRYLFFVLSYQYSKLRNLSNDGSQKNLSSALLSNYKIPLPPLPEQRAIAACLSTWDKAIELTEQIITQKELRKKGLMQQLLTGTVRLRSPAIERSRNGGKRFSGEWKEVKLGEAGEIRYGTRIVKGRVETGIYYVYGGGGKTFTTKEYNRENCLVISRFAMSQECTRFVTGKFYLNDSGLSIGALNGNSQQFLEYLLQFNQHRIYNLRAGGAQQNLNVSSFRNMILKLPFPIEQTAIASVLDRATREVQLQEEKLAALKEQKKGLMQVLLTGKKRLKS